MANDQTIKFRKRWAFLVGVNYYRNSRFRELKHCVNDVLVLERLLTSVGYSAVRCIHDKLSREHKWFPDRGDFVLSKLKEFWEGIDEDDLLFVYFACHGTRSLTSNDSKPYLIFRDTDPGVPGSELAISVLKEALQKECPAQSQVLFLDACHMGVGEDYRGDDLEEKREFIRNVYELSTGFALLTASSARQKAKESDDLEHGVFSNFVIHGLQGGKDGLALVDAKDPDKQFVSVKSLGDYVHHTMLAWAKNDEDIVQFPHQQVEGPSGDIILVDYRDCSLPDPVLAPVDSGTGVTEDRSTVYQDATLHLGTQLRIKDRQRKIKEKQLENEEINKKIAATDDYKKVKALEELKNQNFDEITELDKEIRGLMQGNADA